MRESCSCGAGIVSISYKRVREWRQAHRCNPVTLLDVLDAEVEDIFSDFIADEEENE